MKKFLIKTILFFAILFVIDRIAGYAFRTLSENAEGGFTEHYHYLVDKTSEDILVFGSSRAIHHYNPQIITDSLGMSCYNCGQNGNGIILFYGWWQMISQRYHPKMIIYDITDDYDLIVGEDNHKYLGWLKEGYGNEKVRKIFQMVDSTERWKMMSMMYRYNSKWHQIVADNIYQVYEINKNGYMPLEGEVDTMRIRKNVNIYRPFRYDNLKLNYLQSLVRDLGDTKIAFVVSPSFYGLNEARLDAIRNICQENGISFYNFANDSTYVGNERYFKDGSHLNARGADRFTSELMEQMNMENQHSL